jgi:hypothetical protein
MALRLPCRHDLHESNARGVINADVDELPTNTMMAIDCARIASSDAMSHGTDASGWSPDFVMDTLVAAGASASSRWSMTSPENAWASWIPRSPLCG